MKEILFLPPSDKELDDTIEYYNDQFPGLEYQFLQELMDAIEVIQKFPNAWKKVGKHTHKLLLKRFPHLVLYIPEKDKILITAIAHNIESPNIILIELNDCFKSTNSLDFRFAVLHSAR